MTVSVSFRTLGPFREVKEIIIDRCSMHEQIISTIYEQSILPVDDIMAEDLIVSCCTEENNSVADECQMNPDVNKWTSMEDWLYILLFPCI